MKGSFAGLAIVVLAAQALTFPVLAAGETTPVKVALTDMSSAVSGGRGAGGAGWGMMGPGMMGQGWSGPGQGGNWQMGPGMMGGWGGPGRGGHWGQGMMGYGMMAVRIDHDSVKAGEVHFDVTNWSRGMIHELLVVKVDNPDSQLPYNYAQAKVAEDQVKVLGDTGDLEPNASAALDVTLTLGTYMLFCNVPGHYAAGMATPLTVVP
jgi:uncharacterized cupredoxin-like copper-binding protein